MGWNTLAVIAQLVIIEGPNDGLFVYNGTPAAGNLIATITAVAGTDLFGNAYQAGITSYDPSTSRFSELSGSQLVFNSTNPGSFVNTAGNLHMTDALAAATNPTITIDAPEASGSKPGARVMVIGSANTSTPPNAQVVVTDSSHFGLGTAALMEIDGSLAVATSLSVGREWYPPANDPTGTADRTAIQNAVNNGFAIDFVPSASYAIDQPLTLPTGARLLGTHGSQGTPEQGTTIKPGSSFAGASLITFAAASAEQEIGCLNLDASSLSAGSVVGISASGLVVTGLDLHDLLIVGAGFNQAIIGGGKGWWLDRVTANGTNGTGFSFGSVSDTTWQRCHAIGCGATGFFVGNCANGKMIGCKAEFCTTGFNLSAAWVTGNGAGGFQMTGCSTDRNKDDGTLIDATGTAPMNITGHMARRDGSSGGSWGGVTCNASTVPVSITGLTTYVGVNDDGSGSNGPKYGFQIINSCHNVNLHSGEIMGATAGLNDDGSNTNWFQGPFVLTAHGTTGSLTWNDIDFLAASRIRATGLAGATASSRYAGATTGGAPATGTFQTGDFVIDTVTPAIFVCTAGGSPGTWAAV